MLLLPLNMALYVTPPTAGVKISSIRLLVICLHTWLGATPTKVVYSFEDQQRQKNCCRMEQKVLGKEISYLIFCKLTNILLGFYTAAM